jgi:SAM-dependent methyltransferase
MEIRKAMTTNATPVVFCIFNRADTTEQVFSSIAAAQPPKLLVVADGPRTEAESESCRRTRAIIEKVDWPCQVLTNFAEINMGCRERVSSGLTWAFEQVEEAIILEDDCVPHPDFFPFCQALLERYRDDERVMMISGDNFLPENPEIEEDYFFSRYFSIWGWATWRRAWVKYESKMAAWPALRDQRQLDHYYDQPYMRDWLTSAFDSAYSEKTNTWAVRWFFTCLFGNALCVVPSHNLVSNVGYEGAHHDGSHPLLGLATSAINLKRLKGPPMVFADRRYDSAFFEFFVAPSQHQSSSASNLWTITRKARTVLFSFAAMGRRAIFAMIGLVRGQVSPRALLERLRIEWQYRRFLAAGNPALQPGYEEHKRRTILPVLDDGVWNPNVLPVGWGWRLDERVVEYPWFFARLPRGEGRLLDAGSTLNFPYILRHPRIKEKKTFISTLAPESAAYWADGISYIYEDIRDSCFRDAYFDFICCISTMEHVGLDNTVFYTSDQRKRETGGDYKTFLIELHRVLRKGGRLYLTIPFGKHINHGWLQVFDADMIDEIVSLFRPSSIVETIYQYNSDGWIRSDREAAKDCLYFDIHKEKRFGGDYAVAARAVACIELAK